MAKKEAPAKQAATETKQEAPAADAAAKPASPTGGARGPKGVPETAVITVLAQANPKRPGSMSHDTFALYKTGMTVKEFLDAIAKTKDAARGTGHLVYDTKHGFISIEGYTVPGGVLPPKAPKVAKPKPEKEAKGKKEKVELTPEQKAAAEAAEAEVQSEVVA